MKKRFLIAIAGLFVLSRSIFAMTFYTAMTGSDDNTGSIDSPFATIRAGIKALASGDTLYIRQGTYEETCFGNPGDDIIANGTSWEHATLISAYPGEEVIFKIIASCAFGLSKQEEYIIFDHLILDGPSQDAQQDVTPLWIAGTVHHIRFINGEIRNNPGQGTLWGHETHHCEMINSKIHHNGNMWNNDRVNQGNCYIHGAYINGDDHIFDGNEIYQNLGYGLHFYSSTDDIINRCIIRNNHIHDNATWGDCSAAGILVTSGTGNQIYNNIVYSEKYGIAASYDAKNTLIYNNTVYDCKFGGIDIGASSSGVRLINNISFSNGYNNDISDNGIDGYLESNMISDPQFADAAQHDFHLLSTSPAVDAGAALSEVSDDYDGVSRPQGDGYDIGAYEYSDRQTVARQVANIRCAHRPFSFATMSLFDIRGRKIGEWKDGAAGGARMREISPGFHSGIFLLRTGSNMRRIMVR